MEKFTFQEILKLVREGKVLNDLEHTESLKLLLKGGCKRTALITTYCTEVDCRILQLVRVVVEHLRSKAENGNQLCVALNMLLCYFGLLVITREKAGSIYYFKNSKG